jgi:hypothetical protein
MTDNHPITPPPELVERLCNNAFSFSNAVPPLTSREIAVWLIEEAYVAGADQELEACVEWLEDPHETAKLLRDARRPKPPTLKEQALAELQILRIDANTHGLGFDAPAIRRALEALPE